jgi:hypothetical protein
LFGSENLRGKKEHLRDLDVNGSVIIEADFQETGWRRELDSI